MAVALITGASTGIGRATALRLGRAGWTVLAGVREIAAGEQLAQEPGTDGRVIPVALEVTDSDQVAQAAERVRQLAAGSTSTPGGLDALVNNAGIGVGGPLELVAPEDMRRQFEVNVLAQVAVTQAMLPALRRTRGRIIFVSSIGGRVATPFVAPYAASKHAVEALADGLRIELATSHVQVALVEPGSVATPIWEKGRAEAERVTIPDDLQAEYGHVPAAMDKILEETARRGIPPDAVAETIERALSAPRMRARYLVGRDAKAMLMLKRALPDHVFDRVLRRALGV
ncbi:MAG TPA: SDR family NAD(P)-dependent oxidoreductase [Solirubrobacteraceae bacterium]|nr:SDR family NAD(P)-dependent oxidoreductase [Solirubrobacteraceae bacterium]